MFASDELAYPTILGFHIPLAKLCIKNIAAKGPGDSPKIARSF